jgi:hypothetical protein
LAQKGQADGGEASCDLSPGFGTDQGGQLGGGVVRLDVHGGLLPGKTPAYITRTPTGSYFTGTVSEALGLSLNSVQLAKSRVLKRLRQELAGLVE